MSELREYIHRALFNQDNTTRSIAEQKLVELREGNPTEFFKGIISLLANEAENKDFRQACGTLVRQSLVQNTSDHSPWLKVEPQTRESLKLSVVDILLSIDPVIKKSASNVLFLLT